MKWLRYIGDDSITIKVLGGTMTVTGSNADQYGYAGQTPVQSASLSEWLDGNIWNRGNLADDGWKITLSPMPKRR